MRPIEIAWVCWKISNKSVNLPQSPPHYNPRTIPLYYLQHAQHPAHKYLLQTIVIFGSGAVIEDPFVVAQIWHFSTLSVKGKVLDPRLPVQLRQIIDIVVIPHKGLGYVIEVRRLFQFGMHCQG